MIDKGETVTDFTPVQQERLQDERTRYSRPAVLIQIVALVALAAIPLIFPSFRVMDVVAKIMIFTIVVASYDLILGYTGLLSLGHSMFFGIGAYSLALVIAFFSLRVKAIFFAMMTLALAEFTDILAVQWYDLTRAEDGVSFKLPGIFDVGWSGPTLGGIEINGRFMIYYFILLVSVILFLMMVRFIRSPVGRVLKAIRDNEPRATALGYKTFRYQVFSIVFGSGMASLGGILFAMWLGYVNPGSTLSTPIMLNILLMVIIGGLGTLYGSIIGAAFIKITETWLPDLQNAAEAVFPNMVILHRLAERWILYFGILFILVVFFFPRGFVGTAREMIRQRRAMARKGR